jgi:hypothetical protein
MKHSTSISFIILLLMSCTAGAEPDKSQLQTNCLAATVIAIDKNIQRNQENLTLTSDPKRKADYKKELTLLAKDKVKYHAMSPDAYSLPEKITHMGLYGDAGQIIFDNSSRSSPGFLVLESAVPLMKGHRYSFEVYVVYRRTSSWPSSYVYVAKAEKIVSNKAIDSDKK